MNKATVNTNISAPKADGGLIVVLVVIVIVVIFIVDIGNVVIVVVVIVNVVSVIVVIVIVVVILPCSWNNRNFITVSRFWFVSPTVPA